MADRLRRWFRITARSRRLGVFAMGVWTTYALSGDAESGEAVRLALGALCAVYWLWWSTSAFQPKRKKAETISAFVVRLCAEYGLEGEVREGQPQPLVHRTYVIDPETWRQFEDAIRTGAIRAGEES